MPSQLRKKKATREAAITTFLPSSPTFDLGGARIVVPDGIKNNARGALC